MSSRNGWAEVRAIGIAIRAHFAASPEAREEILSQYATNKASENLVSGGVAQVKKVVRKTGAKEKREIMESIADAIKDLGPAGKLALSDLPALELTRPAEVVMAFFHAIVLSTSVHNISVKCLGSDETDESWDPDAEWPNIMPKNWNQNGNFSFRYELSQQEKSMVVQVKAMPMGELLLVTALPQSSETPITVNIKTSDFVTSNAEAITAAATEFRKGGSGIYAVLSRAASTQLNDIVQVQLMTPLLDKMGISTQEAAPRGTDTRTHEPLRDPLRMPPRGPGGMPPRRPGGTPTGPFPGGLPPIGGDDLGPRGMEGPGGGGSLFGPGNRNFDEYFGRGAGRGLPQGTPPGARFDPYGPGRGPPGRGPPGRGPPSGPGPDHLRRPGGEDDDSAFM